MPLNRPSPRGSVLRILVWIVSIVLILGIAAAFGFDRMLRNKYEPAIGAFRKEVTEHVGFFCEQQTLLAKDAWFHEPRTEGDAGPLLNAWLAWDPQPEPPKDSPLTVPAHLPQKSADLKDWLTASIDVSTLDFDWMRKLRAYDRWDIARNTPTPLPAQINLPEAPLPYFGTLQLWTKFRLLHGLRTGQPVEAARDVRHLAWLSYRTDTLLGGAIARALLKLEREAYDAQSSPVPEWQPMSQEQLDRMTAVFMSSTAFSNIAAPVEVAKQARSCGAPAVSRCMALTESSFTFKYLQPLVGSSYDEAYSAFTQDLAKPTCATSLARTYWERGFTIEEHRTAGKLEEHAWLDSLPGTYAATHIAGILIAIGPPNLKHLKELRTKTDGAR
ncbi:hypothetical protein [Hyalangium rubrum]|uniref:Uncharacterized protein n=1 Tax=Hyalangium rubrum TaxID=3103134 RepID=A0ABU5HEJ0_9BACT|nr:hypothetical protein [Hyalangium sp. s54d21]MDY7231776.1 hypothetical protein [Hyalangium sp. s54d21]